MTARPDPRRELAAIAGAFVAIAPREGRTRADVAAAARDALDAGRRLATVALDSLASAPGHAGGGELLAFAVEVVATAATLRALAEFRLPADAETQAAAALRFAHQARELGHRLALEVPA